MNTVHIVQPSQDLLGLMIQARISAFCMALEIMHDRIESKVFDAHRLSAWMCAEKAGYQNPELGLPAMLAGVYELPDAWHYGQMLRKDELYAEEGYFNKDILDCLPY